MMSRTRRALLLAALFPFLAATGCDENGINDPVSGSQTVELAYSNSLGQYRALVYIPAGYDDSRPMPVVVNVHGCGMGAEYFREGTGFDEMADREGFIVVYPDHETQSELGPHLLQCWRFYNPLEMQRRFGDADAIAELTRMVMDRWAVDEERVYILGASSGAFMAGVMGAAYPELYAAIGLIAGGPYASTVLAAAQPVGPTLAQVWLQAQLALQTMGERARVVPLLEIHGTADTTIYPQNGYNAVRQWLYTNNLVVSGGLTGYYALEPTDIVDSMVPGGRAYHTDTYRDPEDCIISQHVRIDDMGHQWPGTDEGVAFGDPSGPSANEIAWDFFRRYTRASTAPPCTELKVSY